MRLTLALLALVCGSVALPRTAVAYWYTVAPTTLRTAAGGGRTLQRLPGNETVKRLAASGEYVNVETLSGQRGFVARQRLSNRWLRVFKSERRLELMEGSQVARGYRVALSSANPLEDKIKRGDSGTPEGRFFVSEMTRRPAHARYGARSMRLSYPTAEDARRALGARLIDRRTYLKIVRASRQGRTPPQRTPLGGSIRIHGGGSRSDWTLGCIALADSDVRELFERAQLGMRVDVYRSRAQQRRLDAPDYLARLALAGAKRQLRNPARYTRAAMGARRIDYPGGDIKRQWAVCTDIVIRALRHAGLDLQALVHEHIQLNRDHYRRVVRRPNTHIDHRRVRTLQRFFSRRLARLPNDRAFSAGDIVLLDTGIDNGTAFDHIGVVDERKDPDDLPLVINIWTVGHRTAAMDLLGQNYPTVVGHFRLTHPFDYQ